MPKIHPEDRDQTVCIVGLGFVGLTLGVAMADCGFTVEGVEIREQVVELLRQGKAHFHEPGLTQRLQAMVRDRRLQISREIPNPCHSTVFIITVGTPLGPDNLCRLDMIERVTREIAACLKDGDMVIARSTVRLGVTLELVKPILDATGKDYDLAFCPERTVEGRALHELRTIPQIVGGVTRRATARAAALFSYLTPTVIQVSSVENAEMIKLISNSYRDLIFGFGNEVANLCDAAGVSAFEVINASNLSYPRSDLKMPGPVGGPCLEKDPHILIESVAKYGVSPALVAAARAINERQPRDTATRMRALADSMPGFPRKPVIALMGLAFKGRPETDDLRGSMAIPIHAALKEQFPGASFRCFDKVISAETTAEVFGVEASPSIEGAMQGANLVVIANNHPCFESLPIAELAGVMADPGLIYDYWNHYDMRDLSLPDGRRYVALGDGSQPDETRAEQRIRA